LYRLGLLRGTTITGMAPAIKADCADILADHGPSDDVETLLHANHLVDIDIIERLAASYFEVNRPRDAFAVNRLAIDVDRTPKDEPRCRRVVRGVITGDELERAKLAKQLHDFVHPDPRDVFKGKYQT